MLLALVLCFSVLPTAGVLVAIARSDLESALDDFHWARVGRAAWATLELVRNNLLAGGTGDLSWPDPEVSLEIDIRDIEGGWRVLVTARTERAVVTQAEEFFRGE